VVRIKLRLKRKEVTILSSILPECEGSSVGIVTGYGLDDRGWGFIFRRRLEIFLFTTVSRPTLGPTEPPSQRVSGSLSPGLRRAEREAEDSPPCSTEVKNTWRYTSTPPIRPDMVKHRDNFTFTYVCVSQGEDNIEEDLKEGVILGTGFI